MNDNYILDVELFSDDEIEVDFGKVFFSDQNKNYNNLINKPKLNGITIEGDHTGEYYNIHGGVYNDSIGSSESIGGWSVGETAENMTFQDFAYKLLHKYYEPILTIKLNKKEYYLKGTTLNGFITTGTVTKKTNNISNLSVYVNNEFRKKLAENIDATTAYTYENTDNITEDTIVTVKAYDGRSTVSIEKGIHFINPVLCGVVDEAVSAPTQDDLDGLNKIAQNEKNYTYSNININYGKIIYAYPKSLGALTSIKDANNIEYINSYNRLTINYEYDNDTVQYYCYILKNAVGVSNFTQIYK